jgi:hypothetical protein
MTKQQDRARCALLRRLWQDDRGALIAGEWLLFATVLTIGLIPAYVAVRNGAVWGLLDLATATSSLDQSYSFSGQRLEYRCWDRNWYPHSRFISDPWRTPLGPVREHVLMPRVADPDVDLHGRWGGWVGTTRDGDAWDSWHCGAETAGSQFIKLPPAQAQLRPVAPNFQGVSNLGGLPCN